ncbi:hypothetical protein GCM10020295_63160 [Streptomyces cinereospinus]
MVAALAFPERVAQRDGESYLMVSGTRAEVGEASPLRGAPWIAVAVADRPVGRGHARVRLAAEVDEDVVRLAAGAFRTEAQEVRWADGDVVARRVERFGAVESAVRPLPGAAPGLVRAALLDGLRREGFGLLRWSREADVLRQRLAFLRWRLGEPWPDVSDEALHARVEEWLEPELGRARRRGDLARIDAGEALARLLPWASGEAARLGELAPERFTVPSGSRIRIDYTNPERPVLAVKLQEMFGLAESPSLAGVPVVVHLLSPAGRPAAVTADLASFWRDGYRGVRAELRGPLPEASVAGGPGHRRADPAHQRAAQALTGSGAAHTEPGATAAAPLPGTGGAPPRSYALYGVGSADAVALSVGGGRRGRGGGWPTRSRSRWGGGRRGGFGRRHGQRDVERRAALGGEPQRVRAGGGVRVQLRQLQQAVGVRLQAGQGAHGVAARVLEVRARVVLGRVEDRPDQGGGDRHAVRGGAPVGRLHLDLAGELAARRAGQRGVAGAGEGVGGAGGDGRGVVHAGDRAAHDGGPHGERAGLLARPQGRRDGHARGAGDDRGDLLAAGEGGVRVPPRR